MTQQELKKKELELKLRDAKRLLGELLPMWCQLDRKIKTLQSSIKIYQDEMFHIDQGQLLFDPEF